MLILLLKIALLVSVLGIVALLVKKIPVLIALPGYKAPNLRTTIKKGIRNIMPDFSGFSVEIFLQKFLSKTKVVVLKIERKINHYLKKIKQKDKKEDRLGSDEYWDKLDEE